MFVRIGNLNKTKYIVK